MRVKVSLLLIFGFLNTQLQLDILLGSVFHTNESESEVDFLIHDHPLCIGSSVHDIDLRDHTNSSDTFSIQSSCCPNTFRSGHISISRHHTQDDSPRVSAVSLNHIPSDLFDVFSLACYRD